MDILPLGGIFSLLILFPNLLFLFFPPKINEHESDSSNKFSIIILVERIGQAGCFVLPFLYRLNISSASNRVMIVLMAILLIFYYVCWIRYYIKDRGVEWFYRPMFGMMLPMAVLPVLYFFLASLVLQSMWLLIAVILLAIGHLTESWRQYRKIVYTNR
ncbi:MAG TPA: hypothetical protein VMU30_06560 [Bacteroidota bacterium]|nr:hypothetical protein [Bacteroidota bacterium]